jgi:hypothetical protein
MNADGGEEKIKNKRWKKIVGLLYFVAASNILLYL